MRKNDLNKFSIPSIPINHKTSVGNENSRFIEKPDQKEIDNLITQKDFSLSDEKNKRYLEFSQIDGTHSL